MTLRHIVLVLLLANLGFWAWSEGWLGGLGLAPVQQAEPERLTRQVRPEAVTLGPGTPADTTATEAAPTPAPAPAPQPAPTPPPAAPAPVATVCLQAGPFDARQADALRTAAAALPDGSWRLDSGQLPGRWMAYIGPLADADAVASKRAELVQRGIDVDRPGSALEPGLSLGRFSTREAAERAQEELTRRGIESVRVVPERLDTPVYTLRLPRVDAELRARLDALPLAGRELRPCD